MEAWQNIASLQSYEDFTFRKAPVPEYDEESYRIAFQCCKENKCGTYDTNWGCNPGAKRDVPAFLSEQDYVIVVSRTYEVDYKDRELMKSITEDIQRTFRRMIIELRNNNLDCIGFLDGPCLYCGECAYPDPCRFPEMKIESISTLGLNLRKWFESFGESFGFEEGKVTLYGFIFVRAPDASA
ncbi:MAG: hypothetical protein E7Z64_07035 [Thermoplasmata archaeon]|nr:hypothetical protein [Thermoplasmata archaeon]